MTITPPHNSPRGVERLIFVVSYIHSHANRFAYVCQICSQSVQLFATIPTFLNLCHPDPSRYLLGLERLIRLADVHSQTNLHACVKFGPDRSSCLAYFPHLLMCDPYALPNNHWVSRGYFFLADIHSQMNLHRAYVCQCWSRSV